MKRFIILYFNRLSVLYLVCLVYGSGAAENMNKFKVLIANPSVPRIAYDLLEKSCEVLTSTGYDKGSILKNIAGVDAILWAGEALDKQVLDAAGPSLKVIATMSAGYNHIDLNELKSRGIKLSNTPKVLDDAVADVAVLLALAASRRITEGRQHIEKGTWINYFNTQWMLGQDISGSTIGIIGLGGIGQTIAKRLKGFEVQRILYTGHKEKPEGKELGADFVNLDTLTAQSDFIFISAPLTNETAKMCNADFFSKMKRTGIFINVSRGDLVDQDALIAALRNKDIFAAGLDVMTPEPLNQDSELLKLDNVVLLPHLGSATNNTRDAMAELAAQNILRGLGGEELFTPVHL